MEVLALLPFQLPLGSAFAQGLVIDHRQVGCVVAERFPLISARIDPASNVGQARVYFRAAGGPHWYFVAMKVQGADYAAALPKPKNSTPRIEYYIEALDKTFAASRTAEYTPEVVTPPGTCAKDALMAPALTSAKLVVGAAAGAPAIPLGFSAAGSVAAAGGISTVLVVGVAGAGAAVAAVAASSGGSKGAPGSKPHPGTGSERGRTASCWSIGGQVDLTARRSSMRPSISRNRETDSPEWACSRSEKPRVPHVQR